MLAEPCVLNQENISGILPLFSFFSASYCFSGKTKAFNMISEDLSDLDPAYTGLITRFCSSQSVGFLSISYTLHLTCQ